MKSKQFCSVCKQWLEMEVAPTGEDDDGVIWFRCPQCQGYLPKLGGDLARAGTGGAAENDEARDASAEKATRASAADDDLPWDSPADMMAARRAGQATDDLLASRGGRRDRDADSGGDSDDDTGDDADERAADSSVPAEGAAEPIAEYAAQLAAVDPATAVPYRPWETYDVGQCVHHLAWDDCGVVVAKESLPGGRQAIKCYFASAGVVRLIEGAAR